MDRWYRLTPDELKKEFRDFKLKVMDDVIVFNITNDAIDNLSEELDFVKNTFREDDILTGSIALRLFGLLHRRSSDVDILIKDKNRYSGYIKERYGDDETSTPNRLGYLNFKYKPGIFYKTKEYEVDFFEDLGSNFTEIPVGDFLYTRYIRIHNPIEILDFKMKMAIDGKSDKHNEDLTNIFLGTTSLI